MYKKVVCRHCCQRNVNRPRGLCWKCFYTPGVKHLYPIGMSKFSTKGHPDSYTDAAQIAPEPTDEPPGTEGKIKVMMDRISKGYRPFHPHDRRM